MSETTLLAITVIIAGVIMILGITSLLMRAESSVELTHGGTSIKFGIDGFHLPNIKSDDSLPETEDDRLTCNNK